MKPASKFIKHILRISILSFLCLSGTVYAINASNQNSEIILNPDQDRSEFTSVLQPIRQIQAQSQRNSSSLRSKSEVMQEVKSRYNGQVVKISLNDRTQMYSVRVLLPNGKVKNLSVSARK